MHSFGRGGMKMVGRAPGRNFAGCGNRRRPGHEDGAIAIMFAGTLLIIVAFCGLALDLSRVHNRKIEMQTVADAAALAAAYELDGTPAGVQRAEQKASARLGASTYALKYRYGKERMTWSDSAIEFATSPDGPWVAYGTAAGKASPNGFLYVRVSTGGLDPAYSQVDMLFMPVISRDLANVDAEAQAVAGRSSIAVTPLGICAMRPEARRNRNGELEEYGFRRGVSYDLMQLNPEATSAGQTFLIHPLAAPGSSGTSASDFNTVAPFVCTGTMGMARVMGGTVHISSPFPLGSLYQQLNSRFESYTAPCNPDTAPPDRNLKEYKISDGSVPWMSKLPAGQAASLSLADGKRWTVAGPDPSPSGTTADQYGPLWSYARAVKFADPAPSGGYTAYDVSDWKNLYTPGQPSATSYPAATPYAATSGTNFKAPARKGVSGRRVLNVALLSCPVSGNRATVVGIGRFFMTMLADDKRLPAEFAGLAEEQSLRAQVKLYQ